jgi:hypothetical protein
MRKHADQNDRGKRGTPRRIRVRPHRMLAKGNESEKEQEREMNAEFDTKNPACWNRPSSHALL